MQIIYIVADSSGSKFEHRTCGEERAFLMRRKEDFRETMHINLDEEMLSLSRDQAVISSYSSAKSTSW
jgi:hypothetical protein